MIYIKVLVLLALMQPFKVMAVDLNLEASTKKKVQNRIEPILNRLCKSKCKVVAIKVDTQAKLSDGSDMGFESTLPGSSGRTPMEVSKIVLDVQIDSRVTSKNRERLERILALNLKSFAPDAEVLWSEITLPRIGQEQGSLEYLKKQLHNRLSKQVHKSINRYCPNQCILEQIVINGELVTADQAQSFPVSSIVRGQNGEGFMRVHSVDVDMTMDESVEDQRRDRISEVLRARTRFIDGVEFSIGVTPFPETYLTTKERLDREKEDPYGLEKLRQMLIMFRELAGTKEIITSSSSEQTRENSSSELNKSTNSESESLTEKDQSILSESSIANMSMEEIAAYVAGFLVLLTLLLMALLRVGRANKQAGEMIAASPFSNVFKKPEEDSSAKKKETVETNITGSPDSDRALQDALRAQALREEILNLFIDQPKVAKDTFSRMIREDGVEETAKFVHIFGKIVVFELLSDPTLQRDLYELSEHYHRSNFEFDKSEELELLLILKTRVTASEIRILTQKSSEKFDFLTKLDAGQIFNLIKDEKVQVQSIVLTQLSRKKRNAVFEMYKGVSKVSLLEDLSSADAIPKEYMINVAQALQKKVKSSPEYDTENLRASDILLDLLEKSSLSEQRNLMSTLQANNPETARSLKMKLVTIEILGYLKDGHLLEVILGIERATLLAFLASCPLHIRNLLVTKAPEELADSWIEDLQNISAIDEDHVRMADMKVKSKIRHLANNGVISLLDINDVIYSQPASDHGGEMPDIGLHAISA